MSDVFLLIKKNLEHIGNVKAQVSGSRFVGTVLLFNGYFINHQEERGAYFGRVFAFLALLESGKLQEPVNMNCKQSNSVNMNCKQSNSAMGAGCVKKSVNLICG